MITKDLGAVTAFGLAKEGGLPDEVSKEEYSERLADYWTVGERAKTSAEEAEAAKTEAETARDQAQSAQTAAETAVADAESAKTAAQTAATDAQTAKTGAESAQAAAESAKNTAVNAVDGFAAGAQQALDSVNEAGGNWKSLAEKQAGNSEAWAVGQRGGVDIGTQDATYHNNAKYYAEKTATDSTTAQTAATNASQSAAAAATSASAAAESARTLTIDPTLTQEGQAAGAKETGGKINGLKIALEANIDGTYQSLTQGSYNVPDVGSVMSTTKSTLATYASAIIPCVAGDIFTAKLYGGGSVSAGGARAYAFLNASYEVLYRYIQNTVFNGTVTAPENAAYFVANTKIESPDYYVLKGRLIATQISELKNGLSETKNDVVVSKITALELKYYDIGSGLNLIDKETTVKGYINPNGVIIPADSGYHVTDYIPVKGNDVVSNSIASSNILPYAVYDSTFTFLRTVNTTQYTYISGDAYIRITIRDAQYEEARAFYGTALKNYRPFIVPEKISPVDVVVGPFDWCDYANVDDALNGITDDSPTKQYTIRVLAGVYPTFSMRHSDPERTVKVNDVRWINIVGDDPYTTIFFDNRGNRDLSPCNIFTNGRIENITFQIEADAEHYSPTESQTSCYAVHQDYNASHTQYINCRFLSNVGPAYGAGLFPNTTYELINCYFESTCDGSFGSGAQTGQGAIFVHTYSSPYKAVNQVLKVVNSIAVATAQSNGGRFAVIGSSETAYGSTYDFIFQNFGCFGQNGARVNLQDPDGDLLSHFNFNNLPSVLNTAV